jgi:hypothetical protein
MHLWDVNNVKIKPLETEIRKFQMLDLPKELKKMQHANHCNESKIKAHRKQLQIALQEYAEAFQDQHHQTKIYKDMVLKLHAKDTHLFKAYYNPENFNDNVFYDSLEDLEDEYHYQTENFSRDGEYYDTYQYLIPPDIKNKCHSHVNPCHRCVKHHKANKPSVHLDRTYRDLNDNIYEEA